MSEMLFFGAGASVEADVPGAYAMTSSIVAILRSNPRLARHAHALSYVVGGLLFAAGKKNLNPLEPAINVEELFNAVQLLAERSTLEAAPFIGSWHSFLDELDRVHTPMPSGRLERLIYNSVATEIRSAFSQSSPPFAANKIDSSIQSMIKKSLKSQGDNRTYPTTSSDSTGKAVEQYMKALTDIWSTKLKSPSSSGGDEIQNQIERQIKSSQGHPGDGVIFSETTNCMITALKELVWIEDAKKTAYLSPVLNVLDEQDRLVVATLNYDNSVELLASSQNVPCNTGIGDWSKNGQFKLMGEGLHLLKLHGSIDWRRMHEQTSGIQMPVVRIQQLEPKNVKKDGHQPAVIFGSRNKLTAEGPFLDLLRCFQDELANSQFLTVVGYSFRDPHINVYISQWLNGDSNRVLRVINGTGFNSSIRRAPDTPQYVRDLLEFAETNPNRVKIVPENASAGLKTLYGSRDFATPESIQNFAGSDLDQMADYTDSQAEMPVDSE